MPHAETKSGPLTSMCCMVLEQSYTQSPRNRHTNVFDVGQALSSYEVSEVNFPVTVCNCKHTLCSCSVAAVGYDICGEAEIIQTLGKSSVLPLSIHPNMPVRQSAGSLALVG